MDSTNLTAQNPAEATAQTTPTDLVLLIFIHGFKGTDSTFGEFPQRLQHLLTETLGNTTVESITFPAYETKGELNAAVVRFADWLTDLTVRREVANGGAGRAKIVLCGHSMGGLLAADSLIEFVNTRPDKAAPLWPNIVACLAYDTPYLGLHPHVFKNSATQAADYVKQATNVLNSFKTWRARATSGAAATAAPVAEAAPPVPPKAPITAPPAAETSPTSLWQKWAVPAAVTVGGALFAGAAGTAAYYKRDEIGVGFTWVTDHLKYVGNLWNQDELERRLERLLLIEQNMDVLFHTFFTYLPPNPPSFPTSRTFAVLPHRNTPLATHFGPNRNTLAADEIQAHTGMFDGKTNDGYYDLGLVTAQLIRSAVYRHRELEAAAQQPPVPPKNADEVKAAVHSSASAQQAEQVARSDPSSTVPVAAAAAGQAAPVVTTKPLAEKKVAPSAADDEESSEEEDDEDDEDEDDEEEEEEEEEEEANATKTAVQKDANATKTAVQKDAKATKEESSEEEDEDDEDDEDEDEDDEDEDDEEEDDEDEADEEQSKAPPAKKA